MTSIALAPPTRSDFEQRLGQRAFVAWFTGLSGSGKSTLANALAAHLHAQGLLVARLDGDKLRQGLCQDLGFSASEREENLRRFAHVARLMLDQGLIVIVSTISPLARHRSVMRSCIDATDLSLLHVDTSLKDCEARDPKGLYKKARNQEIPQFTGISAPYERPDDADLQVSTRSSVQDSLDQVIAYLTQKGQLAVSDPSIG